MKRKRYQPNDSREWLNRAKSSLAQAQVRVKGVYLEDLCFNAQQTVEKAFKALLIADNIEFPYTHDLSELLTVIEKTGIKIPETAKTAAILTEYAVESRYPGLGEQVSIHEYQKAIKLAAYVVKWVEKLILPRKNRR